MLVLSPFYGMFTNGGKVLLTKRHDTSLNNDLEISSQPSQNGHYFHKIRDFIKKTSFYENNKQDEWHAKKKRSISKIFPCFNRNEQLSATSLSVVCEHRKILTSNNGHSRLIERVVNALAQCDTIYQTNKVVLVVLAIDVLQSDLNCSTDELLKEMDNYNFALNFGIKNSSDIDINAGIFFRHERFNYGRGNAFKGFCGENPVLVDEWNYTENDIKEMSFLFGFIAGFDYKDNETVCKCLTSRGCVMRDIKSETIGTSFSGCDMDVFKWSNDTERYKCTKSYNLNPIGSVCGNGILEENEICDCGTLEMCRRNGDECCEPRSCVLKVDAQCSYKNNPDCCQPNCYFRQDIVIPRCIEDKLTSINESSHLTIEKKIGNVAAVITDRSFLNSSRIVALVADILVQGQSITYIDGEKENVLENVLGLINIILDIEQSLIVKAQNEYNSSNKVLETLDIMVQIYSNNYKFQNFNSTNIGMSNSKANHTDIYIVAFEDSNKKMSVLIQKNLSVTEEINDAIVLIPMEAIPQQSLIYAFVYRNPYLFLNRIGSVSFSGSLSFEASISSVVVSVSVVNQTITNLRKPISMQFKKPIYQEGIFNCYFWNSSINAWSGDGCYKLKESNVSVYCECNHLTNFALILDTSQMGYNPFELKVITWIGCGVSIVTLLLTVLILLRRNLRKDRTHLIHLFMCVSLLILLVLFITGVEKKESSLIKSLTKCKVVAAGLHYFVLTTFCWMAVEGANLYQKITVISKLETKSFMVKSSFFAWGVPLPVVIYVGAVHNKYLGNNKLCTVHGYPFYIGMLLPVSCIIIFNLIVLSLVIIKISKPKHDLIANFKDEGAFFRFKKDVKTVFVLSCLLGTTWLFAVLSIGKFSVVFQWIFSITTSFQGFFLFLHHIALNPLAQNEIRFCMRQFFRSSHETKRKDNSTTMTLLASKE